MLLRAVTSYRDEFMYALYRYISNHNSTCIVNDMNSSAHITIDITVLNWIIRIVYTGFKQINSS